VAGGAGEAGATGGAASAAWASYYAYSETARRATHSAHAVYPAWDYIESQLTDGSHVCPGVVFPARPSSEEPMKLIEEMFLEEGVPVV
jgi:hypothetical protein